MDVERNIEGFLSRWVNDPLAVKFIVLVAGFFVIHFLAGLTRRWLDRLVSDAASAYGLERLTTFLAYLVGFLYLTIIFRDNLGGLTVALGVAGAGIAFALQEVIVQGRITLASTSFELVAAPGLRVEVEPAGLRT